MLCKGGVSIWPVTITEEEVKYLATEYGADVIPPFDSIEGAVTIVRDVDRDDEYSSEYIVLRQLVSVVNEPSYVYHAWGAVVREDADRAVIAHRYQPYQLAGDSSFLEWVRNALGAPNRWVAYAALMLMENPDVQPCDCI